MKSFFNLREQKEQVTVGDYTTKHFDMCPSAVELYSKIKDMTPMVHLVVENMMLHDLFFRLEKQAIAQGAIDEDDLEKAEHYAGMIMDNAEQMGLEDEHSYIEDVHLAKFEELAGMGEEDYGDDMSEKTLTAAELKKREEIAKAIKRENPNMPMAKKMAIATATAKKVTEAADDLSTAGNRRLAAIANSPNHPDRAAAKNELNRRRTQTEEVERTDHTKERAYHIAQAARGGITMAVRRAHRHAADLHGMAAKDYTYADAARKASNALKEEVEQIDELSKKTLGSYVKGASASAAGIASGIGRDIGAGKKTHKDDTRQLRNRLKGVQTATDKLTKEETNLEEKVTNLSHARLKFHATKGVPHGSYSNKEIKAEHDRRMRTEPDYVKAKASMNEENLDEISQATKDRYIQKSMGSHGHYAAVARDAKGRGDETTYQKARRIMKKRNQGMGRAFGQTKDTM